MLSIFICEDNVKQRENLEETIKKYNFIEDLEMELVLSTGDPQAILTHLKINPHIIGLYFIDVNLENEMNGMTLATEIRKLDRTGKIVFVTTHSELVYLTFTYKIEALDYIIKTPEFEEVEEKVRQCLKVAHERYIGNASVGTKQYKVKINGKTHIIPFHEVMFFETTETRHITTLNLENSKLRYRSTLKEIADYSFDFLRIHNSVVVNVKNISSIDRKEMMLEMKNGQKCSISIRGLRLLSKKLHLT